MNLTPTNRYALWDTFKDADTVSNMLPPTRYPHIKRALQLGLVTADGKQVGGTLSLTDAGRAVRDEEAALRASRAGGKRRSAGDASRYQSKPGQHGTLYRYRITYRDDDPGSPTFSWHTWAYDEDHALERWYDSDDDTGWKIVAGPTRVLATTGGKRRHARSSGAGLIAAARALRDIWK